MLLDTMLKVLLNSHCFRTSIISSLALFSAVPNADVYSLFLTLVVCQAKVSQGRKQPPRLFRPIILMNTSLPVEEQDVPREIATMSIEYVSNNHSLH